jgi:molecular chaperone DnaK
MSPYYLGVDLGTTYTAAAVWRDGRVEITNLGNRAAVIPSVVLLRDDGSLLVGEAADRRATVEPGRVAREFKRRFGDPTPIVIGGTPYSADGLAARLLRWVVDKVTETEGGPPAGIAVTYPANWGNYKTDLLGQAIARADLDRVATVTEPEAAAIHYASQERIEPGSVVAVYDLGGGTFDVAVLRKTAAGWDILGQPEGVERLGGVDIDEAVFQHVVAVLDGAVERLDPDEAGSRAAVARLRADCVEAKEALSSDTDVSIPVFLPDCRTEVRLTRRELESMVRPALDGSIVALRRALRGAGVSADEVTTVLLVGGSSRVPLVAQLVGSELGRPVAIDAHPKYSVALGAAIVAAGRDVADAADRSEVAAVPEPPRLGGAAVAPAAVAPVLRAPPAHGPGPVPPAAAAGGARYDQAPAHRPSPGPGPTSGRGRGGGLWLVLLLVVGGVAAYVAYDALLASDPEPPSGLENIDNETLAGNCELGSMRSCDRLFEAMEADADRDNASDRVTSSTCGGVDMSAGHFGDCEETYGREVTTTTAAGGP